MPEDDDHIDYKLAEKELQDAVRKLCEFTDQPVPDFVEAKPPFCSFCGKGINQVRKMVEGPSVHICDECVATAQRIIEEE
jgi:hypothetical protein